tara:strand:- start:2088 stop:2294 length:207 start_codon:yes stop_codon:yes gene_type:complete
MTKKKFKVWEWTKRLGQQHWSFPGKYETLCGRPMLGNNYAKHVPDNEKTPCEDCQLKISFWQLGESHD